MDAHGLQREGPRAAQLANHLLLGRYRDAAGQRYSLLFHLQPKINYLKMIRVEVGRI